MEMVENVFGAIENSMLYGAELWVRYRPER